jgi:type VI secretion system protein ImpF
MALSLSVFDRLIDDSPEQIMESEIARTSLYFQVREALKRDLEAILNSRRRFLSTPDHLGYLDKSVLNYGLTDFTNDSVHTSEFRLMFRDHVMNVIARLEPRLSNVDVKIIDNKDPFDRSLRFRIQGVMLLGEGEQEEIIFNSFLDAIERSVVIEK